MSVKLVIDKIEAGKQCDNDQPFSAIPQTAIVNPPGRVLELKRFQLPYDISDPKFITIWWQGPNPGAAPGGNGVFENVEELTIQFMVNYDHGIECPKNIGRFDLTPGPRKQLNFMHVVQVDGLPKGIFFDVFYHVIANADRETSAKQ